MRSSIVTATSLLLFAATVLACKVPVFRYALDRWPSSEYVLKSSGDHKIGAANLKLEDGKGELFAPFDKKKPIWTGEVDEKRLATLLDSPKRKELVKRILAGDSAVWILVESGDEKADKALFDRLDERLTFFQSVAELPEIDPADPASQLGPGPKLQLKFSILKIKHDDPKEALLLKMLAGPKAEKLKEGEPFVAPVFGQGRVLGAWSGKTMDVEGIEEACFFLTGACSCEVKNQNPGWDLLLSVDWEKGLKKAEEAKSESEK